MISKTQRAFCSLLSIAGAFGLMLASDPAVARPADDAARTTRVSFDDLNLARPAGVAAFERRLAVAAAAVCATGSTRIGAGEAACRARAVNDARRAAGLSGPRG